MLRRRSARCRCGEQPRPRVDRGAEPAHFEVEVWSGRAAGRADVAERCPADNPLSRRHGDARQVGVPRLEAEPVLDDDEVAVAARVPLGEDHASTARRAHPPAGGGRHVESGVAASTHPSEPIGDRRTDGPEEPDRIARSRVDAPMAERPQRRGSRDSVDGQPRSALVAERTAASVFGPKPPSYPPGP